MQQIPSCHVMAKPSGSVCNIDCKYCFYLEKDMLYPERQQNWRMSDETLEQFVRQHIEAQQGEYVDFAWQGGEPTLLGLGFYQRVVELCDQYGGGKSIRHAFQTNGLVLNDEWCEFFKRHQFLIGISIDGPEDLHDYYRVTRSKRGTHNNVMEAIKLLNKHGVEFNTLTVVNAKNVQQPMRVYEFLKSIGSTFIQFIPIVERETTQSEQLTLAAPGETMSPVTPWSVTPDAYGKFLNTIFDYWVRHDVGHTFVQSFDSTLASWLGEPAGVCIFSQRCGHAFALEANGDLYQCDHYVYPEYKLGNIHQASIQEMNNSQEAIQFGKDKSETLNQKCLDCRYRFACHGGCPKHRFELGPSGKPGHNYLCNAYFSHFKHTEEPMKIMAQLLKHGRPASDIMIYLKERALSQSNQKSIGRNSPCPCGSSKKYKRCCGAN
ncbi:anaerobic sulfatase maturase [Vibrio maritimus]|uniref:anaerobic sulfatase maturase n=1 Tax=Vibrio maritimus TaxID=990268 RepID=UPI004067878B